MGLNTSRHFHVKYEDDSFIFIHPSDVKDSIPETCQIFDERKVLLLQWVLLRKDHERFNGWVRG